MSERPVTTPGSSLLPDDHRTHETEAKQVRRSLGLLRSVILTRENWTDAVEREYQAALNATRWLEESHG